MTTIVTITAAAEAAVTLKKNNKVIKTARESEGDRMKSRDKNKGQDRVENMRMVYTRLLIRCVQGGIRWNSMHGQ